MLIQLAYMLLSLHIEGIPKKIIEFINECTILTSIYHVLLFTDFTDGPGLKYELGWSISVIILFTVLLQLLIANFKLLKHVIISCKEYIAKRKAAKKEAIYIHRKETYEKSPVNREELIVA